MLLVILLHSGQEEDSFSRGEEITSPGNSRLTGDLSSVSRDMKRDSVNLDEIVIKEEIDDNITNNMEDCSFTGESFEERQSYPTSMPLTMPPGAGPGQVKTLSSLVSLYNKYFYGKIAVFHSVGDCVLISEESSDSEYSVLQGPPPSFPPASTSTTEGSQPG